MKISKGTLIRTIILALALINQVLAMLGLSPLNIADDDISTVISTAWTIIAAVAAWWKNNSFTDAAIRADDLMHELKGDRQV